MPERPQSAVRRWWLGVCMLACGSAVLVAWGRAPAPAAPVPPSGSLCAHIRMHQAHASSALGGTVGLARMLARHSACGGDPVSEQRLLESVTGHSSGLSVGG